MTDLASKFQVNRPMPLGAAAGVVVRDLAILTVPKTVSQGGLADPAAQIVVNDAASLAAAASANIIWSAPLSALNAGTVVPLNATLSNGLVVSQIPPGAAVGMDYL
jgi:hypothetical protein